MTITSTRTFEVTFARPCDGCGGLKGEGLYGYANGQIVSDTWSCACGRVYYSWTWESTMVAAREARAAFLVPSEFVDALGEVSVVVDCRNAPVSAGNGQPSKPDKPRGQMEMWD